MADPRNKRQIHLTGPARRDLADIMQWTVSRFGERASLRYDALIKQALKDIAEDPERPGSRPCPEIMMEGTRIYHISLSRTKVAGIRVKEPRHFLLYRSRPDGVIVVPAILHDSRDLARLSVRMRSRTDDE